MNKEDIVSRTCMIRMSNKTKLSATGMAIVMIFGTMIAILPYLGIEAINAQSADTVIYFPSTNVYNTNNETNTLALEFLLLNNGTSVVEVVNPEFGLTPPFIKLAEGQKFMVNPPNDEDIQFNNASVKLSPIVFISPDVKIEDADPENPAEMSLGTPVNIGNIATNGGSFVLPNTLATGNYILSVHLQYPFGITGVFSNVVNVTKT